MTSLCVLCCPAWHENQPLFSIYTLCVTNHWSLSSSTDYGIDCHYIAVLVFKPSLFYFIIASKFKSIQTDKVKKRLAKDKLQRYSLSENMVAVVVFFSRVNWRQCVCVWGGRGERIGDEDMMEQDGPVGVRAMKEVSG